MQLWKVAQFPVTIIVLAVCGGLYLASWTDIKEDGLKLSNIMTLRPEKLWEGETYRLFSSIVYHKFWLHLAFNLGVFLTVSR